MKRNQTTPRYVNYAELVSYALSATDEINRDGKPSTFSKAISSADSKKWVAAMQEEIEPLHNNGTWELVKPTQGKKVVDCKWVFKRKESFPDNEEVRYKFT